MVSVMRSLIENVACRVWTSKFDFCVTQVSCNLLNCVFCTG